jgi:hypothetical protein
MLLIIGMCLTASTWLIWGLLLVGIGGLLPRLFGLRLTKLEDVFTAFWVGLVVTISILQLWHFVLPIDERAALLIGILGLLGLVSLRGELFALLRRLAWHDPRLRLITGLWVLFLIWLANRALNIPLDGDSQYYHLSAIQWLREYPIIPGLANLLEPLGYNNVAFLYGALLDTGIWRYHSYHFASTLLMVFVSAHTVLLAARLRYTPIQPETALSCLLLGLWLMFTVGGSIVSHSTDYAISFLAWFVFTQSLASWREDYTQPTSRYRLAVILIFCVVSLCFKWSLLPFFALIGLFTVGRWWQQGFTRRDGHLLLALIGIAWGIMLLWLIRTSVLSGYPLFPLTWFALDVDWRLPPEQVDFTLKIIRWSGFYTGQDQILSGTDWIIPWLRYFWNDWF